MSTTTSMLLVCAATFGAAIGSDGCSAQRSPLGTNGGAVIAAAATPAAATAVGKAGILVLGPSRPHDISSSDTEGTVQFRVISAPSGALEGLINTAVFYKDVTGAKIPARGEFSVVKGTQSVIVTVHAASSLAPKQWYTLVVAPGTGVQVSDAERIGADGRWRMRLYTGVDPQVVSVKETGSHIQIGFSEPINLADIGLSLSSKGTPISGCFETALGCVTQVTAPNVLTEEVSFKLNSAAIPEAVEVSVVGGASVRPVQLAQGSWKFAANGNQSWRPPVTE